MQFGESSKLIVGDNARLDYGFNGVGNLALRSRSSIEIGEGAELHINNNVMLFEYKYDSEPEQIYMTLNKGSKLSFGELAHIGNDYSMGGLMKLNIYMKGGEVDLTETDWTNDKLWGKAGSIRTGFSTLMVPVNNLKGGVLPKEIVPVVNAEKIEKEMLAGFMVVLTTLGFHLSNNNNTRLLSKEIPKDVLSR